MEREEQLKKLIDKRDRLTTSFFWLALKIALIIGIPAFVAAYFGKKLDSAAGKHFFYTFIFLVLAFILSWIIIYFQYKKLSKKLEAADAEIGEFKKGSEKKDD